MAGGADSSLRRSFESPDRTTAIAGGRVTVDAVDLGGQEARRVAHAPGWRWTEHSAAEVGSERCPRTHVGVMVAGRMWVEAADGSAFEAVAGDVVRILPGHDAWTLGDEPAVLVEFDLGPVADGAP